MNNSRAFSCVAALMVVFAAPAVRADDDACLGRDRMMSQYRAFAFDHLGFKREAEQQLELRLASPCLPEAKKLGLLQLLASSNYVLRNYPKAIEYASDASEISRDTTTLFMVAAAHYQLGNFRAAADDMQEVVANDPKPTELHLKALKAFCRKADGVPCVQGALEKLAILYPDPKYSMALIKVSSDVKANDDGWK